MGPDNLDTILEHIKEDIRPGDFVSFVGSSYHVNPKILHVNPEIFEAVLYVPDYQIGLAEIYYEHVTHKQYGRKVTTTGHPRFLGTFWDHRGSLFTKYSAPVYTYRLRQGLISHPDKDNLLGLLTSEDKESREFAVEVLKQYELKTK